MILGIDKLHQLVKEKKLVEGLCERELNNPEGAGFDFRIGKLYRLTSSGFLGIEERDASDLELVAEYKEGEKTLVILEPGEHYVYSTVEQVNTPNDLMILFKPRNTMYRCGITMNTGNCCPGYCGPLFFSIINTSKQPFKLEMGARVIHAMFHKIDGSSNMYRGQWQGGRVTTEGMEKQV